MIKKDRPLIKSKRHSIFIHEKPCCVCGLRPVEQAHIRSMNAKYGKGITGAGRKPSDEWTVPLCPPCHREQHKMAELEYWAMHRIDPFELSLELASESNCLEIKSRAKEIIDETNTTDRI